MYSILIVEDEYACMLGLQAMIKNSGLQFDNIFTARNGEEALKIIEINPIDLILTDICMPKMDGLQLCSEIRQNKPDITIIIISGYDNFKYAQQAIKYNVKDFILKPVNADNLINSISQTLAERKKAEMPPITLKMISSIINKLDDDLWREGPFNAQASCAELFRSLGAVPVKERISFLKDILDSLVQKSRQRSGTETAPGLFEIKWEDRSGTEADFINTLKNLHNEIINIKTGFNNKFIKEVKIYIKENYNTDISLLALSRKFSMNPCYCSQLFKKKTGKTIVQYKTEVRMKKALELLQSTDYTITEITFLIGYTDISHFTKTFKKYYGKSPSEFK